MPSPGPGYGSGDRRRSDACLGVGNDAGFVGDRCACRAGRDLVVVGNVRRVDFGCVRIVTREFLVDDDGAADGISVSVTGDPVVSQFSLAVRPCGRAQGDHHDRDCQCEDLDSAYFGYADNEDDGNSKLITFSQKPVVDDSGYHFTIDEKGLPYTAEVTAFLYLDIDDSLLAMGESYNINANFETGEFSDGFDGKWLSLPNGQLLSTYVVSTESEDVIYTSPVYVNGKRTNLRIRQSGDNSIVEGTWDGISENNYAARGVTKLKNGDKIEVIYSLDDSSEIKADAYEWQDGDSITYGFLPSSSDYYYAFCIEDTYSDLYITDPILFSIDDKGQITYSDISE